MGQTLQSFSTGTLGLLIALAVAAALGFSRAIPTNTQIIRIRPMLVTAICFHIAHLIEETAYGFYILFPQLLGLAPWPVSLFLAFNIGWIAIWFGSVFLFPTARLTITTFWFLAIASALNGIAHPALALTVSAYFPGLATSPFVGVLGILIIRRLYQASSHAGTTIAGPS